MYGLALMLSDETRIPLKNIDKIALIKVSKFENEFMKSSFLPKYERKIVRISAL